jgi:hypothetical protein
MVDVHPRYPDVPQQAKDGCFEVFRGQGNLRVADSGGCAETKTWAFQDGAE